MAGGEPTNEFAALIVIVPCRGEAPAAIPG
jgi:hypothetical protein